MPRKILRIWLACFALAIIATPLTVWSQSGDPPAPRVRITTNLGEFVIELDRERAPLTVDNFLAYVRAGHYTGTLFHRVIANFVIQGGGVTLDYRAKPANKPIANESGNGLRNLRGTVGLARAASPHSGDAQFYVNIVDNAELDPLATRWGYAVFGRVVEGMEVVDRISNVPTGANAALKQDAPLKPVVIEKAAIVGAAPGESLAPPPEAGAPDAAAPEAAPPATPLTAN